MKNICPCCGLFAHTTAPGDFDICPICKWEDDGLQRNDADYTGGANSMSLNQAKKIFAQGKDMLGNPIFLPLITVTDTGKPTENLQIMATCKLVIQEGRTCVLV